MKLKEVEEFLENHPGLKGENVAGNSEAFWFTAIHKTQLDKQKVRDVINTLKKDLFNKDGSINYCNEKVQYADSDGYYGYEQALKDMAKELGLEEKETERHCDNCKSILTKEIIKGKERLVCTKGHTHPDGDFSYLCGSDYCRCCQ
ncbi:MAG TPA: hypothetical protein ENI23_07280 [bacterium]|nr:hypothetical protein [bacterium]